MSDTTGSIIKVESERQNAPGTGNQRFETKRTEFSGLITVHATVPGNGNVLVATIPAGFRAYITRLMWDWTDDDGMKQLVEDFGGAAAADLYMMGLPAQQVGDDPTRLNWGDGSYPVITACPGAIQAISTGGAVESDITITYYLEAVV